ncbi:MAG: mucoidy inhibitor MuiA family protein [Bacteroidales bacterium]|nr:mucoidy inhibitor MuiA family protein [Bacteroidales bacterium]
MNMKIVFSLIALLIFNYAFTQVITEKEIKTEAKEVTVFLEGAQIHRKQNVNLSKGETILKFINLSPFIDAKSIQVKVSGDITVLSVNHQQNFLDKLVKPQELINLESKLSAIESKIKLENAHLSILKEELIFLRENRVIGGRNQEVNVNTLKEASTFYGSKLSSLILKEIEIDKLLLELYREKQEIDNQIRTMTNKKEISSGEILVKVEAKKDLNASFEITYIVSNASWFPSYDIRAKNVNEPIELVYKANVRQDTKEDWKSVTLKFSSSQPNVSGVSPELKPYYLNYNIQPPTYHGQVNRVTGVVLTSNRDPLPGASVLVSGTTIGVSTDVNGYYSLTIPANATSLTYSFIGFKQRILPISGATINVLLEEDMLALEEVVVSGVASGREGLSKSLQGRAAGVSVSDKNIGINETSSSLQTEQIENQTTVDFEISIPFTVNSDNKSYSVDMAVYQLPAFYEYLCVPKIDRGAFLIANIVDWEKYSLLEGEANVFFEETYVGKTILDVRNSSDTLQISLGRDKSISVNREKTKDLTSRRFIGNRKEEVRNWKTIIRNNKGQKINMVVYEQVPVSTNSEIEVIVQKISSAKHNPENGEIKWEFTLEPAQTKEFEIQYTVRFPRNRNLIVE